MSSHTNRRWASRLVAAAGAVAIGTVAFAAPALAAPEFGNINQSEDGSITLHKHEHQSGTSVVGDPEGGGTAIPSPAVDGVVFTAFPISNFDPTDAADWDSLAGYTVAANACGTDFNTPALTGGWTLTTPGTAFPATGSGANPAGVTSLTGLDLGAYLICETDISGAGTPAIVDRAVPFIVTVPFPDNQVGGPTNSNGWLYDVHAYPKNGRAATITKSVTPQPNTALGLGSVVSFPVVTDVPRIPDGDQFTFYTVRDDLDPRLGTVGVASVTGDGFTLTAGTHYTIVVSGNTARVNFTAAGLTVLKANGGKTITTVFQGTVISLVNDPEDAGVIDNTASFQSGHEERPAPPTTPTNPENPNIPSDPVTTNWGDLKLFKYDGEDATSADVTDHPLDDAEFQVYAAADPYGACDATATRGAGPISVNGQTTFTSENGGVVSIAGLFVSDSVNAPINASSRCYILVETAAPAGFVQLTDDIPVSVTIGTTDVDVDGYDSEIANTKQDMPDLPLTGAQGQLLLMLGGGALVLIAVGAAIVARKRNNTHAAE